MATGVSSGVLAFVETPASPRPLAFLRIGIAAALIAEAAMLAPHLHEYYGPAGVVQGPLSEAFAHHSLPSLLLLSRLLSSLGVADSTTIYVAFALYVVSLHLLLVGCWTRVAAIAAWLLFLAFKKAGSAWAYGGFEFAQIALFYCVLFPVGGALSIDAIRHPAAPSTAARVGLRLLQLHLCIVYLASGIEKSLGEQWWNGEAIWRALMRPGQVGLDFSWLAEHPVAAKASSVATILCETGYPLFVWLPRTRKVWLAAIITLHVSIAVTLGLVFFSAVMIVLNVAAFVVPAASLEIRQGQQLPEARVPPQTVPERLHLE